MTWDSVDLPEPFGPMIACTSPGFTVSDSPWRISRSSTRTCKFLTSSNDIRFFRFCAPRPEERRKARLEGRGRQSFLSSFETAAARPPQDEVLSNRTFKADRDQLLRFHRELHRQLLQHVFYKAVDDEADGFFLGKPALHAIKQHVFGNLRR